MKATTRAKLIFAIDSFMIWNVMALLVAIGLLGMLASLMPALAR